MLVLEYKVKGKPKQYQAIEEAIRTVQFVRNKCLRHWMDAPKEAKVNYARLCNHVTELRNEFPFVQDLNSMAAQASAERGWFAISRFYDNCKAKKPGKKGYPRFQKDNRSVEYKTSGWKLHPTKRRIAFTDKKGIGELRLLGKWDIHTYPVKSIKRVRLVRRADSYYCQFAVDTESKEQLEPTGNVIGLDVGLEFFYTDSNGHQEENPRFLRKAEQSIKHAQRHIYKKQKGKNGRRKARKRFAKKHLKGRGEAFALKDYATNRKVIYANASPVQQRNEHASRLARCVIKSNDLVAYEDLNVRNMIKNHCLAKSISDASWTQFRQWLEYFASKFDRESVAVKPHYTSQKCSHCGAVVKKSLSVRTHVCKCGCRLNRDENAAINILNLALQARGGHPRSNAVGVRVTTLVGETLLEQTLTLSTESPRL